MSLVDKYLPEARKGKADLAYTGWSPKEEKQMIKIYTKKYKDRDAYGLMDDEEAFKLVGKFFKDPDDVETAIVNWINNIKAMTKRNEQHEKYLGEAKYKLIYYGEKG